MELVDDDATMIISGQLDVRCLTELRDAIYEHLSRHEEPVVLDLSGVESADLAVLRMLAVASRLANSDLHRLSIRGCPPGVRRLLHLCHLRGLLIVEPDAESA